MIRRLKVFTRGQGVKYLSLKVDHVSDGKYEATAGGVYFPVVKCLFLTLTFHAATFPSNHPTKETAHVRHCRALPEDP
jgi:hypothetical protein